MKPDEQIQELFSQALTKTSAEERARFLAEACQGNPKLRHQLESLLRAHEEAGEFLGRTVQLPPLTSALEEPGTMIGRYKLIERIGEGGFGVVYRADQVEPVRRQVALKIIKAGMDTREVVARFEAERQALARMSHPNIAGVLDAGATQAGRPYFAMELVNGIPITDFCDREQLPTTARLRLFLKVCQAVQHAHQKGIIHRDLKPSNVLVTLQDGEPVPKVIDFGVAKALSQRLTEKTFFTAFQQMIGTPAYMSPEQAGLGRLDVDTRSDVYSLGVLLYELLTGRTPFDTKKLLEAGYDAVMRTIREEEPPKPSTRLSTLAGEELIAVAAKRGAEPAKLNRLVRGDLDWIVMKALEKDRQRRYETANAFAGDVEHYLNHEPVVESSRDGRLLAVAMGDNSLQCWNTATGQRWGLPMKTGARVMRMGFSSDGRLLVTAESGPDTVGPGRLVNGAVRLWDTATGLPCGRPIPTAAGSIFMDFQLSLDSRFLCLPTYKGMPGASARPTPAVQVWRLPTSDVPLAEMQRRTSLGTGMRLDPGGNVVADGRQDERSYR